MNKSKRVLLSAGLAVTAGAFGAALSWQKWKPSAAQPDVADKVWQHSFEDLQGQIIPINTWAKKPMLLNFWATWCPPCVEEMPMLNDFYQVQADKCTIVGLAVDRLEPVRRFVKDHAIGYPILLAGPQGLNLTQSLGNDAGGLPFSAFFNGNGDLIRVKVGKLSEVDLSTWV